MEAIRLLFDKNNRLWVVNHSEEGYALASLSVNDYNWHPLIDAQLPIGKRKIFCALGEEPKQQIGEWQSIFNLHSYSQSSDLSMVLSAIDSQLYRIPYLGMGENEYIYRFRTAKERNRSIYIDEQSEGLYQSALCRAIKEARRTREKSSGKPAVLDFGAVSYVIPSHFGFCLGVQNAIERAYETVAIHPNQRVFMLSELIHNPFVNEDLLARGLRYLQTDKGLALRADGSIASNKEDPEALWNQLTEDDIVIIPAFGATNEDKARLIQRGLSIRDNDATCMLVEKVWKAARRYAQEGYTVLIHGKSEHEETKATFSNSSSHGPALMIRNMEHARRLSEVIEADNSEKIKLFEASFAGLYSEGFDPLCDLERIAVVNQTTLLRNETLKIIDYLRSTIANKYGESEVANHLWSKGKGDTLCYATQVNQDALHKAVEEPIDAALVVGGKNSSNTFQLYRVCAERFGEAAHYIQSEKNITSLESVRHYTFPYNLTAVPTAVEEERPMFKELPDKPRILLTGGASCPDGIIQQVIHRINSFFPAVKIRPVEDILEAFELET
ncbi:4-hydroxy-3-methylbut-2-enyl diphosphate reductase [Coraliomargarita sp. SDUM461004]|uniref:4-hydroxy-3-methylbut-2-enyl diphosphate reductase n=1 Tax=Thalassobacterium sedimentorum TaxID=3041258 RepID=A0ABU1AMY3_9BACT|nr:4-hydroxy-3-methylbut-2-enyl diphosphate reductase [Coraliomargarita sp. SDUM461004]MDQ8196039.1 4-hydroxy-3-methylbut-2-enyl diphosphate reductase [Coraliomargarita sp. SDUM461004]